MPIEVVEKSSQLLQLDTKEHRPILTKWKNEPMIRVHSLKATVKEILQVSNALDLIKIGIVGEPATGKTTLAECLGHLIHEMAKPVPYAFRIFGEEEFMDMKATLAALTPVNYILYFHDLSFLTDKKKIEEVKNAITKIRHLKQDVRIIQIVDYHYTLGLDKYLRQFNFLYLTSIGSSEKDNVIKIVGTKYAGRVRDFQEKFVDMTTRASHKCTFRIGANQYFSYNYKNPFVPGLFFNGSKLRYFVFPKREWIEPVCSVCSFAHGKLMHSQIPVEQFIKESKVKFGDGVFEAAIKLILFQNGLNVYARSVVQARKYVDLALMKKQVSLEELAVKMGLSITRTHLRKKLDGVLLEQKDDLTIVNSLVEEPKTEPKIEQKEDPINVNKVAEELKEMEKTE